MGCLLGFAVPWRLSCWIPIAVEEALRLREAGAAAQAAATALAMGADRAVHVLRALTLQESPGPSSLESRWLRASAAFSTLLLVSQRLSTKGQIEMSFRDDPQNRNEFQR